MSQWQALAEQFQEFLLFSNPSIDQSIAQIGKISIKTRLSIYGDAYRYRLLEALENNYPILKLYLGCEQFEKIGFAYINQYPSHYRSIRWFGDKLTQYFSEDLSSPMSAFLVELTKLEWIMTLVFDAADSEVITLETMATIPIDAWDEMRLSAHPSAQLLNFSWNTVQIWHAISENEDPVDPIQNTSPVSWIFWRKELLSQFCSLAADEAYAIDAMLKNNTFGDICQGLCEWMTEEEAPIRAASLLKGWICSGLIADIKI